MQQLRTMDLSELERLCKGDRRRMRQYVDLYLQEAPPLLARLEAARSADDGPGTAAAAHALRPAAHRLGANALFDALTELEQVARQRGAQACDEALQRVRARQERLTADLMAWCASPENGG